MSASRRTSWLYVMGDRRLRENAGTSCGSSPVASLFCAEMKTPPGLGACAPASRGTANAPAARPPAFKSSRRLRVAERIALGSMLMVVSPLAGVRLGSAGVQDVAEAVAHQVEREHGDHDRDAREHGDPGRRLQVRPALVQHVAPGRRRRLGGQTQIRQRCLDEDGLGQRDGPLHDERRDHVRQDVLEGHDPSGRAERPDGLDVLPLALRQHRPAHDSGEQRRVHDRDRDYRAVHAGAAHRGDADREQQSGHAEEHVHDAVDRVVPRPAQIPRREPEDAAQQHRDADRRARDVQRDARAVDHAAQDVAPEAVSAERRLPAGGRLDQVEVLLVRGLRGKVRGEDGDEQDHQGAHGADEDHGAVHHSPERPSPPDPRRSHRWRADHSLRPGLHAQEPRRDLPPCQGIGPVVCPVACSGRPMLCSSSRPAFRASAGIETARQHHRRRAGATTRGGACSRRVPMSSTFLYRLPVEQTQWKVDGQTTTSFTWEYEDGSADLLRLYGKGKKQQWDAASRIDWSLDIDPDNPMGLDDRTIAIYGTDLWNRLTPSERAHVRRNLQAHTLSQFMHGEQGALIATAKIVQTVPSIEAKFYAATQVMDEARHVEAYARLLHEKVKLAYPITRTLALLLENTITDRRWDMTYLGMQVLIEGLALAAFQRIRDTSSNPLAAAVNAYVMQDESRHVAFGRLALRDYYPQLTEAERDEREEFVVEACYHMRDRFNQPEVWDNLGLPVKECVDAVEHSEYMRLFRTRLFSRIVPTVKDIGLWGARVRKAYEDMGVMEFASVDAQAMLDNDNRVAEDFDAKMFVDKTLNGR